MPEAVITMGDGREGQARTASTAMFFVGTVGVVIGGAAYFADLNLPFADGISMLTTGAVIIAVAFGLSRPPAGR